MAAFPPQEHRPLKKPRLGPPDVYPQDPKQKEDELNANSVKHGFSNTPSISDEYGSERSSDISIDKLGAFISTIWSKKIELNTVQDAKKKQQLPSKDNFWPAARNKANMDAWFRDLTGNKPLTQLCKRVPTFNKKEEIFTTLYEFNVPSVRAAWYIKMIAANNVATQETRVRGRRQAVDQSNEWTVALTKFMKEQLQKVQDYYLGNTPAASQTSFLTVSSSHSTTPSDLDTALKIWQYCMNLIRLMYSENMIDRYEFLTWLVDLVEKPKQLDDMVFKLVFVPILKYLEEVTQSALLSRKLAHFCAKKISQLCETGPCSPGAQSPMLAANGNGLPSTNGNLAAVFAELCGCNQHRGQIQMMSTAIQTIVLQCPMALVWNSLGDGKNSSFLCGSPLDLLPCAPSSLPMVQDPANSHIRQRIRNAEMQISSRGRAAEVRWSSEKCQQSATGYTISRVLHTLDTLDRHNFEVVDQAHNMDVLYKKVFAAPVGKENSEHVSDEPVIRLLIDWAVSTQRRGYHRAFVVAKLIERRQQETLRNERFSEGEMMEDRDSAGSDALVPAGTPIFQSLLMDFLDERAPVLEDNPSDENKQSFQNLVHLFNELMHHDVFSHNAYMCTLISRGELSSPANLAPLATDSVDLNSIKSQLESNPPEQQDDIKIDFDIPAMDSDLGIVFGAVKDEPKHSPEPPASVKSTKSEKEVPIPSVGEPMSVPPPPPPPPPAPKGPPRHQLYATHFPIPQAEGSHHDSNQRTITLFGVGKARDEAKHFVKRCAKETIKLFAKRNCIDVSSGDLGRVKKKKEKEGDAATSKDTGSALPNYEALLAKFQKLSYYDQHAATVQCTTATLEQISYFTSGSSCFLPLVENISYLLDLMEQAVNISDLIDFVIQLLRELPEMENQLRVKQSQQAKVYSTDLLSLSIVGVLRKYHLYVLVSPDLATQVFEGLFNVVRHLDMNNTSEWTSANQCILAYLYDLYTPCLFIKTKFSDSFGPVSTALKSSLYATLSPAASNLRWDPDFLIELLNSRRYQLEASLVKQLNEQHSQRYSFVCNAMLNVCSAHAPERLNEIAILCAELTARCHALSSEWLGVLKALCCSSMHNNGFIDVLTQYDGSDMSIHDYLGVFTAILIARHCFSLQDFVVHVALPSLLAACPSSCGDQDAQPGARLTCHLLLRLFKTSYLVESQPGVGTRNPPLIKASCDRHLLEAAHDSITIGAVTAVLKAMLVLGDSCSLEGSGKSSGGNKKEPRNEIDSILQSLENGGNLDMMDSLLGNSSKAGKGLESAGLNDYARHALREMCSQAWVRDKFLKDPDRLFEEDQLIDPLLSNKQAQQLLQMICYSNGSSPPISSGDQDNKQVILRILQSLDQWTLRVSLLELHLMLKQANTQAETNSILDNIAKGTIDLFHQQTESGRYAEGSSSSPDQAKSEGEKMSVWLVAPLMAKLPSQIQGKVLKLAGHVLEMGNQMVSKSKVDKEKNQKSKSLLGHQPFLSLVLTCLKSQDEQREGLLNSLHSQLDKLINNFKEMLDKSPDESKIRQNLHEALQLRLSLVGGMFDTIQRQNSLTIDWSFLLLQLISHGVLDPETNNELFTTVIDMLSVLIHGTLVTEGSEKGEERKTYMNLIKKLRKELVDKHSTGIDMLRRLLPLPKKGWEVITVEPHGTLVDTKGNKIAGFDSIGKKQGLQVAQKVKLSPWENFECYKNPAAIPWSHFGAIKMERKPLKHEEQHRLLLFHSHTVRQSNDYYLAPVPLPPEDLEPPPEKVEDKPKEPSETQPNESGKKTTNKKRNSRRTSKITTVQPAMRPPYPGYQPDPMYHQGPTNNWYGHPQQPAYYTQQTMPMGAPGPRFNNPNSHNPHNPKLMLNELLQARFKQTQRMHPYMPPPPMGNPEYQMRDQRIRMQHNMVRKQLLLKSQGVYPGHMQPATTPGGMHPMGPGQPGMTTSYPYGTAGSGRAGMEAIGGSMMSGGGYSQSYSATQPGPQGMLSSMQQPQPPPAPNYMQQQPLSQPNAQFNPAQRMQPPMSSGSMQGGAGGMSLSGYSQLGPGGGAATQGSYLPPHMASPSQQPSQQQQQQHFQQMRQQQQRLMMQPGSQVPTQHQQQRHQLVAQRLMMQQNPNMPPQTGPPGANYQQFPQY